MSSITNVDMPPFQNVNAIDYLLQACLLGGTRAGVNQRIEFDHSGWVVEDFENGINRSVDEFGGSGASDWPEEAGEEVARAGVGSHGGQVGAVGVAWSGLEAADSK